MIWTRGTCVMKGFSTSGRVIDCGAVVLVCVGLMASRALASSPNQVMPRTVTTVVGSASGCKLTGSSRSYRSVFITDSNNNVIRRVDAVTGIITTYADQHYTGSALPAVCTGGDSKGNGCTATQAIMSSPRGLAFDNQGNLLISDYSFNEVRKVDQETKIITLVAGTGTAGYSGDGGPAIKAQVNNPRDIAVDASNNIYFVDATNNIIRMVSGASG